MPRSASGAPFFAWAATMRAPIRNMMTTVKLALLSHASPPPPPPPPTHPTPGLRPGYRPPTPIRRAPVAFLREDTQVLLQ